MLKIEFSTANAAFHDVGDDDGRGEIARILREIADDFEMGRNPAASSGRVRDLNGNTVGKWSYEAE